MDCYIRDKHSTQQVRVPVGKHSYGWEKIILTYSWLANLKIGNFCALAPGLTINLGGNHRIDWISTYPFGLPVPPSAQIFKDNVRGRDKLFSISNGDIVIGNDIWTGFDVTIMSGVKIGDGAVISSNSVVYESIKPYSIVGGNPAKLWTFRFDEDIIKKLLEIKWWNWPDKNIYDVVPLLLSSEFNELFEYYESNKQNL